VKDIFSLREYYQRNRGFWYFLYPFHIGLYLLVLWHVWLFIGALTMDVETAPTWGLVWGHISAALVLIGGVGVLIKRATDEKLKVYYPRIHYLKWIFVLVTLVGGFYSVQFYFGASMPAVMGYVKDQLSFELEHKLHPPLTTALHVLFVSPWLIYIPFSHIMRLFFRYYHELRWDHVPNLRGSEIERRVEKLLTQPVSWSAPHIQSGKSWSEVAGGLPEDTVGKEG
jgi:nitrate reductase gamma subunit